LFTLTLVSLGYWLAERFYFKPQREAAARNLEQQDASRRADLARHGHRKGRRQHRRSARTAADAALVAGLDGRACSP
jgi:hypothetical protein